MAKVTSRITWDGPLSIMVDGETVLSHMSPETEMAISHELARHAGDTCPCHREKHPQRFIDRLNCWEIIK